MNRPMPKILKGYVCPSYDYIDCSACPYYNTECIVYSKKGRKRYKEWKELEKKNDRRRNRPGNESKI